MFSDLVGVPYQKFGWNRANDGGLDCWGVVLEAYRLLGGRFSEFVDEFEADWIREPEDSLWLKLPTRFDEVVRPTVIGDIVRAELGREEHVLVFVGGGKLLHSREGAGSHFIRWGKIAPVVTNCYRLKGTR